MWRWGWGRNDGDDGVLQLMKLNDDWDQVYRSATLSLQNRIEVLELENTAIKQLNSRLLLKVEHQQVNTVEPQAGALVRATVQAGTRRNFTEVM